ncbi:protein FAM177A1-like [Anthonomus grandis grandis]|uniref:protein FAM177A1-like n=1 Tax=Anthonomus grandis grandis TaxID=2921223 RepID=UPI002166982C|nr:protein FAM177A1-like [Anthonomus grandis grandis]
MVLIRPEDYSCDNPDPAVAVYKSKTPKQILEFSDGVLEEYDTDDELIPDQAQQEQIVDPATMTWGPWMLYKTWAAGASTLSVVDYAGEVLASFFGITTPRYYFELEEYKRRKALEEKEEEAKRGWGENKHDVIEVELKSVDTGSAKVEEV